MSARPTTAFADAFVRAGYRSPQERLDEIADEALAQHPRTLDLARQYVMRQCAHDPVLLLALFGRWHHVATELLLQDAAKRAREKKAKTEAIATTDTRAGSPPFGARTGVNATQPMPRGGGFRAAPLTPAEKEAARLHVARVISKLDTFKIHNHTKPIGDCTPEEALAWRAATLRDARFVYLLCSGLPPGLPIRQFIRPQEAEDLYQRAQEDKANE